MKRLLLVAFAATFLIGCGATTATLNAKAPGANQAVVVSMLEQGREDEARAYLIRVGLPEYRVIEQIEEARIEVLKKVKSK